MLKMVCNLCAKRDMCEVFRYVKKRPNDNVASCVHFIREPNEVVQEIRADIEKERQACIEAHDRYGAVAIGEVLKIFDKHMEGESE